MTTATATAKDFASDQEVRWCPGCGDYAVLAQFQRALPKLGIPKENLVVVSGIGCSSRLPYYVDTYGLHSIHGRAPAFATGLKATRPELSVWVVTGDGDGLSIGGNHLLHVLRRNVDIQILLFNNRIYGLTKGQYSPTSDPGTRSGSTPLGSIDHPVEPAMFALGAGATFIARTLDVDAKPFQEILLQAATHQGTAFIEILQNCPIYNDGVFVQLSDRKQRPAHALYLKTGEPMIFGPKEEFGLAVDERMNPCVVPAGDARVLVHNPADEGQAHLLARIATTEGMPTPLGVLRTVERPTYDAQVRTQIAEQQKDGFSLQNLLEAGGTWRVP